MRVRPDLKHKPRLPFPRDYDYVKAVQDLNPILSNLHRGGRCIPLLLEKATRSLDVAAFSHARDAADSALKLNSKCTEAHWLRALACIGMALNRLGIMARSPATWADNDPSMAPAIDHVDEARTSLTYCLELTDHGDQEAADLLDYLQALGESPSDTRLRQKLQALLA